jgi:hypothetical protein
MCIKGKERISFENCLESVLDLYDFGSGQRIFRKGRPLIGFAMNSGELFRMAEGC